MSAEPSSSPCTRWEPCECSPDSTGAPYSPNLGPSHSSTRSPRCELLAGPSDDRRPGLTQADVAQPIKGEPCTRGGLTAASFTVVPLDLKNSGREPNAGSPVSFRSGLHWYPRDLAASAVGCGHERVRTRLHHKAIRIGLDFTKRHRGPCREIGSRVLGRLFRPVDGALDGGASLAEQ